jgi:hypothetical protein
VCAFVGRLIDEGYREPAPKSFRPPPVVAGPGLQFVRGRTPLLGEDATRVIDAKLHDTQFIRLAISF